jgi:uncharacterized protein (TIGR02996 family)
MTPAPALAETIEWLAPVPELARVTDGNARQALAAASIYARWPADPRVAGAAIGWLRAMKYKAKGSQPFWRLVLELVERAGDPRALPLEAPLDQIFDLGMRRWMQRELDAARAKLAARFPDGAPGIAKAELDALVDAAPDAAASAPPTLPDDELLQAILDDPADDGKRAVYADRLLERGEPRGELIALQLVRRQRALTTAEMTRERVLMRKHAKVWLGELSELVDCKIGQIYAPPMTRGTFGGLVFERGFLAGCTTTAFRINARAKIRRAYEELAGHPLLATVERLSVWRWITGEALAKFVHHPGLKSLLALSADRSVVPRLPGTTLGDRLCELDLTEWDPAALPGLVESIAQLPALDFLRISMQSQAPAQPEAAAKLLEHPTLRTFDLFLPGARVQIVRTETDWATDVSLYTDSATTERLVVALRTRGVRLREVDNQTNRRLVPYLEPS